MTALHRFSRLTALSAFVLIAAGAMVTSTGSGLAVPDWPLSFGKVFPAMEGGVFFEHGHRMIAGLVALSTFALAAWTARAERRPWVRRAAFWAAGLIVLQAVLGGVTVLYGLPKPVSISHACLGQAVFCLLLAVAQSTSPWFVEERSGPGRGRMQGLWKVGATAVGAIYLQLVFGAAYRHTGQGAALAFHASWALAVALAALYACFRGVGSEEPALQRPSMALAAIVLAQVGLGLFALAARTTPALAVQAPVLTAAHLALGAAALGTTVVWTLRARRAEA